MSANSRIKQPVVLVLLSVLVGVPSVRKGSFLLDVGGRFIVVDVNVNVVVDLDVVVVVVLDLVADAVVCVDVHAHDSDYVCV